MDIPQLLSSVPAWSVLAAIAGTLLYKYLTRTFHTWSDQGVPGPKPWPLFGTALAWIKAGNFPALDVSYSRKYGKILGEYIGLIPVLLVSDPEVVRQAFIKDHSSMPNRRNVNFNGLFNMFLTSLNDEHWKHVRSSLSPTFTSGKLKQMKILIDECGERLVNHLLKVAMDDEIIDPRKALGGYTMDVILNTAFGVQVDSYSDAKDPSVRHANKILRRDEEKSLKQKLMNPIRIFLFFAVPSRFWPVLSRFGLNLFPVESTEYFSRFADQILKSRSDEATGRKDFIELCMNQLISDPQPEDPDTIKDDRGYLWSKKGLTSSEIVSNAILFFLAGFDTTSNTLYFIIYELATHPDVQDKILEEVTQYTSSDSPSYNELAKMEYIDCVINEVLRLYPTSPRPEQLVSAQVYAIHQDPDLWPEPQKFDPDRFLPENKAGRHPCAWIPFGVGSRNCIGMRLALLELKIAIVRIVYNFKLESCSETPERPLEFSKTFQMIPEKPIKITMKRR